MRSVTALRDSDKPTPSKRPGDCYKWKETGQCSAGSNCPWSAPHTAANKPAHRKSKAKKGNSRGKGDRRSSNSGRSNSGSRHTSRGSDRSAGGNSSHRSRSQSSHGSRDRDRRNKDTRGRSPGRDKDKGRRAKSPGKGRAKGDKLQPCMRYLKGTCNKSAADCRFEHPPPCAHFKKGKCTRDPCLFLHAAKEKSRTPSPKERAKSPKGRGQARMIRYKGPTERGDTVCDLCGKL